MNISSPYLLPDISSGIIDDVSVSDFLLPQNAVRHAVNVFFHRPRGGASQRYGYTKIGSTVSNGNTIVGLHNFRTSDGSADQVFAVVNGSLYRLNGASWTEVVSGLTNGLKTRFLTYLDTAVYMNGTNDSKSTTSGTAFVTTGGNLDVGNFPKAKFATIINTRVLVGGDPSAPDTIKLSSLVSSGAVSWTSGNKTVQVDPNDGAGGITGVTGNGRVALIFKQRGLYRFDDTELQRVGFVGTPSYESIVTDDDGNTYFFGQGANGVGFYVTNGGRPVKISRRITKYVEAISASFYQNVSAYTDGDFVEWSVGSITIDGIIYTNASLVYCISDQTWTIFNRADRFRVFTQRVQTDGTLSIIGGDTDGDVHTVNSGTTDNGADIFGEIVFPPLRIATRGKVIKPTEVIVYTKHFQGLSLLIKSDKGSFKNVGSISQENHTFSALSEKGNDIVLKLNSVNSGTPWEFVGFEFPANTIVDEGYGRQ